MMYEDYYEEEKSSSVMSRKVTKPDDGGDEVLNKLIHLMGKSTFTKTEFRRSEDIYRNRIRNDIKDLDVLTSDEVKSGYHYLYSRYEELWDYIWDIDHYVQNSLSCIKKHKLGHKDLSLDWSKSFNVLSEYIYMKKNFEYHQINRQQQLEKTIHSLDEIENVDELRDHYDFLRLRFMEFQKYTRMQEDRLQKCTDLLNEITSSFEEEGKQEKAEVAEKVEKYFERSYSESSIPIEYENEGSEYDGFSYDRSTYEGQEPPMADEASPSPLQGPPSPVYEQQNSKIPRPPPPRRAVMPEDVKEKVLQPIPGRVAPDSKAKIFHENLPNYYENAKSAGYGKNTKRAQPSYVQKPQVVLPPLQNTKYRSQQLSSNEICHQDFVQYEESFAVKRSTIKGIVKPNLIRKDLMKLKDPTARPRGSKQTAAIAQEGVVKSSIKCEQLPMIPQPPPRPNNNKINASVGSRIPRLPTIQQKHGLSSIQRPCPPPQPRSRPEASHRRYVARETALPFSRMQ